MSSIAHTDQMGRIFAYGQNPMRIVSLVPSITELLFDLGLADRLVGRTKFCILPDPEVKSIPVVGGTKQIHFDVIERLKPDLIIGNKEENTKEDIEFLEKIYPVWMSDVEKWEDMIDLILKLGHLTGQSSRSDQLIIQYEQLYGEWWEFFAKKQLNVAYLIWRNPFMAAGSGTFIDNFLNFLGIKNAFNHLQRYPEINASTELSGKVSHVFLSSEPYPFTEIHFSEVQTIFPGASIIIVDGMFFSWYGSRLLHMKKYIYELNSLI
jgi:ABC-type Fe3+-hydroxamate transport system substrate-binding protein